MKATLSESRSALFVALLCFVIPTAVAQAYFPLGYHHADTDTDWQISLPELLRVIQFFNAGSYHCALVEGTEDGYAPGPGKPGSSCFWDLCPHHADYVPDYWAISLTELLRIIQFFNSGGVHWAVGTEDGFAPGPGEDDSAVFLWRELETTPGWLWRLEFRDIDGDDMMEVYVSGETSGLAWWQWDGHGGFTRHAIAGTVQHTVLIDFDADGDTDILGPRVAGSGATWWKNDGLGNFVPADPLDSPVAAVCPDYNAIPFVCDLHGNGKEDIIGYDSWWRNEGGLEFTQIGLPEEVLQYEIEWGGWRVLAAADLDGDSDLDLLGQGNLPDFSRCLFWLENLDDTDFAYHAILPPDSYSIHDIRYLHVADAYDIDHDDDLDFIASLVPKYNTDFVYIPHVCSSPEVQVLLENQGDGQFIVKRYETPLYFGDYATFRPLRVADLDQDGALDMLFCAEDSGRRFWHLGWWRRGPDRIWKVRYIGPMEIAHVLGVNGMVLVHDFNGDGFPDIFGVNADGALGWWENQLGK